MRSLNPKSEILSSKQIPNLKSQCLKQVSLEFGKLEFRNCLGFRYWNLKFNFGLVNPEIWKRYWR